MSSTCPAAKPVLRGILWGAHGFEFLRALCWESQAVHEEAWGPLPTSQTPGGLELLQGEPSFHTSPGTAPVLYV